MTNTTINFTELNNNIDWKKIDNLIPAIIQDDKTLQVLMLGYMNSESLEHTIKTRQVTFFSRTKQRLWTKGEESKNFLNLKDIYLDCDQDTLLIRAEPQGNTCHKNVYSCFDNSEKNITVPHNIGFLEDLKQVIKTNKTKSSESSYTAELFKRGSSRIAQKIGEEGLEVALSLATNADNLKDEYADLFYHMLVGLEQANLEVSDIIQVLEQRRK